MLSSTMPSVADSFDCSFRRATSAPFSSRKTEKAQNEIKTFVLSYVQNLADSFHRTSSAPFPSYGTELDEDHPVIVNHETDSFRRTASDPWPMLESGDVCEAETLPDQTNGEIQVVTWNIALLISGAFLPPGCSFNCAAYGGFNETMQ